MSEAMTLLWELEVRGALFTLDGDGFDIDAPGGLLTDDVTERLSKAKAAVIEILKQRGGSPGYRVPTLEDDEREAIQWADSLHPNQAKQVVSRAIQEWKELVNPDIAKPSYACPYCGATNFWRRRNGRITCSGCLPAPPKGACEVVLAECEDGTTEWKCTDFPTTYFDDFEEVVGADGKAGYDVPGLTDDVAWWRTSTFEDLPDASIIFPEHGKAASKVSELKKQYSIAVATDTAKQPNSVNDDDRFRARRNVKPKCECDKSKRKEDGLHSEGWIKIVCTECGLHVGLRPAPRSCICPADKWRNAGIDSRGWTKAECSLCGAFKGYQAPPPAKTKTMKLTAPAQKERQPRAKVVRGLFEADTAQSFALLPSEEREADALYEERGGMVSLTKAEEEDDCPF